MDGDRLSSVRGAQNRSPGSNRTPGRYPNPAVPEIALRVLAVHYPERLPAHPPCDYGNHTARWCVLGAVKIVRGACCATEA